MLKDNKKVICKILGLDAFDRQEPSEGEEEDEIDF